MVSFLNHEVYHQCKQAYVVRMAFPETDFPQTTQLFGLLSVLISMCLMSDDISRLILHTPGSEIPDLAYHIHSLLRLLTQLLTLLRHMILQ